MQVGRREISDETIEWLNGLCWHDSVLYEIRFIRTNSLDQVILILDLLEDWEAQISQRTIITFQECWLANTQMNWGINCMSGGEMIYGLIGRQEGALIDKVRSDWPHLNQAKLAELRLEMAATGSMLELVFGCVEITNDSVPLQHNAPPPVIREGQ